LLNFSFFLPTRIIHGQDVVIRNSALFSDIGTKTLIVTGKQSAKISGALADVETSLMQRKIRYQIFDQVENNPSLDNIAQGAAVVRRFRPDFIVGIGGGSPLDAAKALAVLAVNRISPEQLYNLKSGRMPLPIIAIPTTAGTGSEVTPYSVLTIPEKQTKQGFSHPGIFPKIAFLDYRYTESLEEEATRDTAVDALSHLIEAYLSRRKNNATDLLAEAGLRLWGRSIVDLRAGAFSSGLRESLLAASTLGGMAIAHTGTTVVHALGYPLTYFHNIAHGRSNGLVMAEYLRYNYKHAKSRVEKILKFLNLKDINEFEQLLKALLPSELKLSEEQINEYGVAASRTKNATHSLGEVSSEICIEILRNSLG